MVMAGRVRDNLRMGMKDQLPEWERRGEKRTVQADTQIGINVIDKINNRS